MVDFVFIAEHSLYSPFDCLKAAVRLSALRGLPATYVFTHDSIAVGERWANS